jgi:hypothetical protein
MRSSFPNMNSLSALKVGSKENTYILAIMGKWLNKKVALSKVRDKETKTQLHAFVALRCRNHTLII